MATIKRMIENPSEVLDSNQSGLISTIEINKLSEMKQEDVNVSTAQMLVLANSIVSGKEDMDGRITSLEKQAWYKRMWNSLNGKMKGTKEEFVQNKEKIALYAVQAVSALYEADKFNQDMLLVIKQKITDICYFTTVNGVEHILKKEFVGEIRNAAKELAVKINEATAQLDVLTIINADCSSGKYDYDNPIAAICDVISKLDGNLLSDGSAVDSFRENLCNGRILDEYEKPLYKFMDDVINIPAEMTGEIYIELASMLDNLWAEMFAELMESYNMLPKMERMAKKKDAIIKAILEKNDIDETTEFTAVDLLEALLATRIEMADMTGNVCIENIAVIENSEYIEEGEKSVLVGKLCEVLKKVAAVHNNVEDNHDYMTPMSDEITSEIYSSSFIEVFNEAFYEIAEYIESLNYDVIIGLDTNLCSLYKCYDTIEIEYKEHLDVISDILGTDFPDYIRTLGEFAYYTSVHISLALDIQEIFGVDFDDIDRDFVLRYREYSSRKPIYSLRNLDKIFSDKYSGLLVGISNALENEDEKFYYFGELMDWIMLHRAKGDLVFALANFDNNYK